MGAMADHIHHHHHAHPAPAAAHPATSLLAVDARWRLLAAAGALVLFWGTVWWAMG
jgi:hypothetical protein